MASTTADVSDEPLGPVDFSHYRTFHFLIEPFKAPGMFRTSGDITLDLQRTWNSMYEVAHKTLERDMTCPKCEKKPCEDKVGHKANMYQDSDWVYYLNLHKTREIKIELLDAVSMKRARFDFIFLEDRYLEYDKGSKCKGLDGLRKDITNIREKARARLEAGAREVAEAAMQADPISGSENSIIDHPYQCYELTTNAFVSICKQIKKAQQDDKIAEKWEQMCAAVWETWESNLTCPECRYFPGKEPASEKHRYSSRVQAMVQRLREDLVVGRPGVLDENDVEYFRTSLYEAEDVYLKENKKVACTGWKVKVVEIEERRKNDKLLA